MERIFFKTINTIGNNAIEIETVQNKCIYIYNLSIIYENGRYYIDPYDIEMVDQYEFVANGSISETKDGLTNYRNVTIYKYLLLQQGILGFIEY